MLVFLSICITNSEVLDKLNGKELEKAETDALRKAIQAIGKGAEAEKRRKETKQKKIKEKQSLKKNSQTKHVLKSKPKTTLKTDMIRRVTRNMAEKVTVYDNELTSDEDDAICPECGKACADDKDSLYICCDGCDLWFDFKCTTISGKETATNQHFCGSCI